MNDSDRLREDIEALPVEGFAGLEHAMDGMQELAHDGANGLDLLQSPILDQVAIIALNVFVMARRTQGGHVQAAAQIAVSGLAQTRLFVDAGARGGVAWVESGHRDPLLGAQIGWQHPQLPQDLDRTGGTDPFDAGEECKGVLQGGLGLDQPV